MKKNFLIIAALAGLASIASAASYQQEQRVYVLPTYVVTAPRELPAERQVNESLNEFRNDAQHLIAVPPPATPKVQPAIQANAAKAPAKVMAKS